MNIMYCIADGFILVIYISFGDQYLGKPIFQGYGWEFPFPNIL